MSSEEISKISGNNNLAIVKVDDYCSMVHTLHQSTVFMNVQGGLILCNLQFNLLGLNEEFLLTGEHIFLMHPDLDPYSRQKAVSIRMSIKDKNNFDEGAFEGEMKEKEVSNFKKAILESKETRQMTEFVSEWL